MPNRILRDGIITSDRVNTLPWDAEVFYRRLMSVVDDFGRYSANARLIRAACYPLNLDKVSDSDVEKWILATEKAALVRVYPAMDGKRYLEMLDFRQQVRAKVSKFPSPPDGCTASATQTHSTRISSAHSDGGVSVVEDGGEGGAPAPMPRGCASRKPQGWPETEAQARAMAENGGANITLASTLGLHYDGKGYWPQGSFVSTVKSKQGFNAQDLSDKTHVAATVRQAGRQAEMAKPRPTMQL